MVTEDSLVATLNRDDCRHSPADYEETLSTLRYADQPKKLRQGCRERRP